MHDGSPATLPGTILPEDFQRDRIELDDTGVRSDDVVVTGWCSRIGIAITATPTIVEDQQVAFAGQTARDHVRVVRPDNAAKFA